MEPGWIVGPGPLQAHSTAHQTFGRLLARSTAREGIAMIGWNYLVSGFRSFENSKRSMPV